MHDTLRLNAPRKPRMIAHRGLSALETENTHAAFVAAGNRSYFGIETDVHVTADGGLIIIHDDDTGRVAGERLIVEQSPFAALRALRLRDVDGGAGRPDLMLPSLEEYALLCRKYQKISVLELKNPMAPEAIDRVVATMRAAGWLEHAIFISFALENLARLRARLPGQKLQYLVGSAERWDEVLAALERYRLDLDAHFSLLTAEKLRQVHALGQEVNAWTVNAIADAERLAAMGVDYLTTNVIE